MAKILAVTADAKLHARVEKGLSDHDVLWAQRSSEALELLAQKEFGLVVHDLDFNHAQTPECFAFLLKNHQKESLFLSSLSIPENISLFHTFPSLQRVIARNRPSLEQELRATSRKLLHEGFWGLDPYLEKSQLRLQHQESLHRSEQVMVSLGNLAEKIRPLGDRADFFSRVQGIASELLTNALFDAPLNAQGKPRFAGVSHDQKITLEAGEKVQLRLAADERRLVLSVSDDFGALKQSKVIENLYRCAHDEENQIRLTKGGAGIGLYMALHSASQLIFNLSPGRRSEVICIFDFFNKQRDYDEQGHSLCFFTEEPKEI